MIYLPPLLLLGLSDLTHYFTTDEKPNDQR